jgi:hypothetical protein
MSKEIISCKKGDLVHFIQPLDIMAGPGDPGEISWKRIMDEESKRLKAPLLA